MINLNDSQLEGTIPASLGKVTTLTHLYLASNSFQESVPADVANLANLVVVDLSFNSLSGSLPVFASNAMETIELGHNRFEGTLLPNAVDGMSSLQIFDIKYNLVSGTIPSLSGPLPSLVELDLSNNQFIGMLLVLSAWFAFVVQLVANTVQPHSFVGTIPPFVGQLDALQRLYLSNNRLSGTIPNELGNSNLVLEEIYLHGNILTGTLPVALADLPELLVLFIDGT